jgi:hypothetical protein
MGFALSAFHIAHLPCNSQFEARPNPLAREQPNANLLTFSVGHDADVRNLVFDQNLEVVPILMKFDKHSSLTVPLDDIHEDRIAQWIDDRIVAFIQTFLAIHQNLYYQEGHARHGPGVRDADAPLRREVHARVGRQDVLLCQ